MSQYHKRNWQVEDGLPRNYVMAVMPGADKYLLVGTDEGLSRFDGMRFTPLDVEPSLKLSQRWILSMMPSSDGSLWLGTFDGWIYRYKAGEPVSKFEAGASVFALIQEPSGAVLASTRSGLKRLAGTSLMSVPGLARPPDTAWNVLARDRDGSIWIVTMDGLFRSHSGTVSLVVANQPRFGELLSVAASSEGEVWVGTSSGLFRVQNSGLHRLDGVSGPVVSICKDRAGVLWAGAWGKGLYRIVNGRVNAWTSHDGLADDFIRTLFEDSEKNLWIGTRAGGLTRWNDTPLVPYGVPEGLSGDFATTIASGPDGGLWFGTWRGGLYRLLNGAFRSQQTPVPTLYCTVRALALDSQGRQWIGNWEGLYGYDGSRYVQYAAPGSPFHHVAALLFDRQKRLWVGTSDNGLFLFPSGKPTGSVITLLPRQEVTTIFEDSSGRIWVGTQSGLGHLEPGTPRDVLPVQGVGSDTVTSIAEDSKGKVCATTLGGAIWLVSEDGRATVINAKNGLPAHPLYRIVDDRSGSYWISSPKGILQLSAGQVNEMRQGTRQKLDYAYYNRDDGMRTVECHRISQPSGILGSDGRVWFPTAKGFVAIQTDKAKPAAPPPVVIEEITADDRTGNIDGDVRLQPGTHSVEIRYTALNFSHPEKIQFRYRLEGFDPAWVENGSDRTARYSGIPPGKYRFFVSARLPGGSWSPSPAAISIQQLPRFYETNWFLAALGLIPIALAVAVFRWRVYIIRNRYAAVLAERHRIAREWHDTLLAGFSAISWQIEETLSRLKEFPETAAETATLALRMIQHYRSEARSVIWDLREDRPESETLAESISSSLRQITAKTAISVAVHVEGEAVPLPPELERNVLRICQEASSNAKRHGQPTSISVRLEFFPTLLVVRIQDDGKGFDPEDSISFASGHFGLTVMRERAQRFGGELRLESRPGGGTIVEAKIPLKTKHG